MNVEEQVNTIVKFVKEMYSPYDVWVQGSGRHKYSIIFYFEEIDDKYITNKDHRNKEELKANMLKREIRRYINDFFGIKTTGLQPPDFVSPEEEHPIRIVVTYTRKD